MNRRLIWTDELADQIATDAEPWTVPQATWIAWACVTVGPLIAAGIVGLVFRFL